MINRLHLNRFKDKQPSALLRTKKSSLEFISDLPFYLVLILTAGLVMFSCSELRPTATESYDQIGKVFSEKLRYELHNNPEFAQLIRNEMKVNKTFAKRMGAL